MADIRKDAKRLSASHRFVRVGNGLHLSAGRWEAGQNEEEALNRMKSAHCARNIRRLVLLALAATLALGLFAGAAAAKYGPGHQVDVMTRNLYLGADLTPAINAKNTNEFVQANGQILREVTANNFPVRARGLAKELLKKEPDLVGLQEVAMWRTGPPSLEPLLSPAGPTATTVRYDYLTELLDRLNKGKKRYRVAV